MFHWRDGKFFGRAEDGTVIFYKQTESGDMEVLERIPPAEWVSIVEAVSARSSDPSLRRRLADLLHTGS